MLKVNANNRILGKEIHAALKSKTKQFNVWVGRAIIDADLVEGKDFCTILYESTGGRPSKDYEFTIDAAKEICLLERNDEGKKIRQWLISLSNEIERGGFVSHQQVIQIMRMIKVFSVYEFRRLAIEKNSENYIKNALFVHPELEKNRNMLYSSFHQWRNEVLQTGKDVLSERVKEYCLVEHRRIPAKFTQDEALTMMGEYEMIKNAIWDLLSSQNKSEEMINNICNLAQDMAKEMKPFLERLNQSNLFFNRIDTNEVKMIGLK